MKKVFISQPMKGLSDEEIIKERKRIKEKIKSTIGEEVVILDSYFKDYKPVGNNSVAYLGKSIELLAQADILYSGKGWSKARGCIIENKIAKDYEIEIIYEDSKEEKENISNFKEEIERLREENNNLKYENNQWEEENEKLINNILRLEDCIDNIYVHLTLLEDNEVEFDISAASDDVSNIIKEYYPKYFN